MKHCPTCKMTVDEENECPFCSSNLTYEPTVSEEKEHIIWNRYYFAYIFKNSWFSLSCILIGMVKIILTRPPLSVLFLLAVLFALVSLSASIFQRRLANKLKKIFNEDYIPLEIGFEKYIIGAVALVMFLFL
ncbi:MAG: hypothetical protein IJ489_09675 [Clostridia bacterium]|nr:hypothetical protein [Clostridia bacterium]